MLYKYCEIAEGYINDVMNDNIVVGKLVRLAVERHQNDLEIAPEKGWYFDNEAAESAIKFKTLFNHTYGEMAREQFIPEPWQCFMDYCVYGWKKSNGRRRFSTAYIEVAKKNGKTAKIALDAVYLLSADKNSKGEQQEGVEIYCAATKERQAKECFNQASDFIRTNVFFKRYYSPKLVSNNISIAKHFAKFEPLGRDSKGVDGKRPNGVVIDEYHEWVNDFLRHRLRSASVGKPNYLEWIITTAGLDKTGPCYEWRSYCLDILNGIKIQDDVFVLIYAMDDEDDWKDEKNWSKPNPNYGISVDKENMRKLFTEAINRGGQTEVDFKTKNLNFWTDAPSVWIQDEKVVACKHGITAKDLIGQDSYDGFDLAGSVDINSYAKFYPNVNGHPVAQLFYFIPENKVIEKQDRVDYRQWQKEGRIFVTEGNVIDIDFQVDKMYQLAKLSNCKNIAFDPAKAYHGTVQGLQKKGLDKLLDEFSQSIKNMSTPSLELQRYVESGEIDLLEDPILRWMFRNVVVYTDPNSNIKLDKGRSHEKIDGIIALINAIGGFMSGEKIQPYSNYTPRSVNF